MGAQPHYLRMFLAPLAEALAQADVTDIYVNKPGEIWIERITGAVERHDAPELTANALERLARQIAAASHQGINREHPLLSASLPDGTRVQIIAPPATRGDMALAIRKQVVSEMTLADLGAAGGFEALRGHQDRDVAGRALADLLRAGDYEALLGAAVRARKTILVSGGTATGKTTILKALIREIPKEERLILIEDTPELIVPHDNAVGLIAARSALGEAQVTAESLVAASLRMRPDRIIIGEIRGGEALSFIRAINTGHPGSLSSIHADSPEGAIDQLALLVLQTGTRLRREDVHAYVTGAIDLFVQVSRAGGRRYVSDIALRGADGELLRG